MKAKSIMKRSTFTTRRKIIIYIIMSVLILGIVAGFTDPFITDNTRHVATPGQIIVMESEPPTEGDPSQYDLISNLKFAAHKLHHAPYFRAVTDGTTKADLGITTYTQYVHNERVSNGKGIVFAETISSSSLKSVAEQKYADGTKIIFRPSTSINGSTATFADTAYRMSYEDYGNKYGTIPDQLSKYIINEKTIIGVKDENASTQPAANAARTSSDVEEADVGGFDFYVPQQLVQGDDGNYTFTLTLDATGSSLYYRNEVRTLGGADQNPKFYSVSVTVTIAPDWTPVSVRTIENYDIAIPVLGAMNCTGDLTEVFTEVGNENGVIPEREFFQPYIDAIGDDDNGDIPDIPDANRSPADYLATAFADYLSGARNLDLTVDLDAAGISAYDLALSLNIGTMDIQALLGDLYVKYSGDRVNIKLNGINGYLDTDDFAALMQNDKIGALLAGLGDLSSFDITSLFGGDMLGTVFGACEMTTEDGVTRIRMPFPLDISSFGFDGPIAVDASIYINEEDMSLRSITGNITLFGKTVTVEATPLAVLPVFPSTEGAVDLSGMIDFLPDILTLAESKTFGLSGTVTALGQTIDVSAYVDITDGIKADAVISAMGADVSVKYVNDTVYVGVGAIDARGTTDELTELIAPLLDSAEAKKYLNLIKLMLPGSVNDALSAVKTLEVTPEKLTLGLNLLASPITLALERANGTITGLEFAIDFNMFGISFDAAADLDITTPEAREIALPEGDEYISFTQFAALIEQITPYLDAKAYAVSLDGTVTATDAYAVSATANVNLATEQTGIAASGAVTALGQTLNAVYSDGKAYITLGNIKLKLDTENISEIADPVKQLLGITELPNINIEEIVPQALDAIESLTVADDGKLTAVVQMPEKGISVTAVIDLATGVIDITGTAAGVALDLELTVTPLDAQAEIELPSDASAYVDCAEFVPTIQAVAEILQTKSISTDVSFAMGDISESARLELSFADGLKARLAYDALGLNMTVIGETAYIALGDIRVVGNINDIPELLEAADPLLPAEVKQAIAKATGMLENMPSVQNIIDIALSSLTALTVDDAHILHATVTYNDIAVIASVATDLSSVTADITAGNSMVATLGNISFAEVTIDAPTDSFATLANITTIAKSALPLATEQALEVSIENITALGTTISGSVYIGMREGFALDANLTVADIPVHVVIAKNNSNHTLYLSVNDDLRISEQLTVNAVNALAAELETYVPGITNMLGGLTDISVPAVIKTVLGDVALFAHGANGIAINIAHAGKADITVTADVADGALSEITVSGSALGKAIDMTITATTANGAVAGLACENASVAGEAVSFDMGISGAALKTVEPIQDCVNATAALSAVSEIGEIALAAANGNGIALDFGTTAIELGNINITVSGNAEISVSPLAAKATLTVALANGKDETGKDKFDEYNLDVVYADGIAYVAYKGVKLKLDPTSDILPLYELIKDLLPASMTDMIEIALGNKEGSTPFDAVLDIVDRIKPIIGQPTAQNIVDTLLTFDAENASLAKTILGMVTLDKLGSTFTLGVSTDGMLLKVTPKVPNANSASVRVNALGISTSITLENIATRSVEIDAPENADEYASLSAAVAAATPIMPLVSEKAFALDINCTLFNVPVTGTAYIDISNGIAAEIKLSIGDMPVEIRITGGKLYMSVDGRIKLAENLTESAIMTLITQLDKILPGIKDKVQTLIDAIKSMTVQTLLNAVSLSATNENGFAVSLDLTETMQVSARIEMATNGSTLTSLGVDATLFGKNIALKLNAATDELGTLASLSCDKTDILGVAVGINVGIAGTQVREKPIAPMTDCIALGKLTEFIDPVLSLMRDVKKGVETITLDLGAFALFAEDNSQINVSGKVIVELAPVPVLDDNDQPALDDKGEPLTTTSVRVQVALKLFDGTNNITELNIIYIDDTVYIQLGKILLSLNTATDLERLYDIIANYMPEYINAEIAKLLGMQEGASVFNELSLIIERLTAVANAESAEQTVDLLFKKLDGFGNNSAIKAMIEMIRLIDGDEISVEVEVMGITLYATPHITDAKLSGATVKTSISNITLQAEVNSYALLAPTEQTEGDGAAKVDGITAPSGEYISVVEFAELINDAVNTFTTVYKENPTDEDGDITFAVDKFDFDYTIYKVETQKDASGDPVLDEDGNPVPVKLNGRNKPLYENGQKVIDKTIKISTPEGKSALKGKFVKVEEAGKDGKIETSYRFNLEAHIILEMSSLTYSSPLTLDLYIVNETGNGTVLLDYMEGNGNGERVYLDYKSVMQMVASVMRILNVDPNTIKALVGEEYMLDINTDVFGSMDIAGLGDIKAMIENIAKAMQIVIGKKDENDENSQSGATGDIKAAWDLFYNAGSIETLKDRLDDEVDKDGKPVLDKNGNQVKGIKSLISDAVSKVQSAIDLFGTQNAAAPDNNANGNAAGENGGDKSQVTLVDGKVFHDIVTGVWFGRTETVDAENKVVTIKANVSNEITTGTTVDGSLTPAVVSVDKRYNKEDARYTIDRILVDKLDVNTALLTTFDMSFTAGQEVAIALPKDHETTTPSGSTNNNFANIKHLIFDIMNTANMLEFEIGDLASDKTDYINLNVLSVIKVNIKYDIKVKIIDQGENAEPRYKTAADVTLDVPGFHTNAGKLTVFGLAKCTTRIFFYDNVLYVHGVDSWKGNAPWVGSNYTYDVTYSDAAYTIDELMWMLSSDTGIDHLFNDIVFKLLPLMKSFLGYNIHDEIINAVKNPPAAEAKLHTIAQIFKGYSYNNKTFEHSLTIGLKELALNGSLRDVFVKFTGANDGDENIRDNYLSTAYIETNFAGVADLKLHATLNNVSGGTVYYNDAAHTERSPDNAETDYGRNEIWSGGLNATNINGKNYTFQGSTEQGYESLIDKLLAQVTTDDNGKITEVTNRQGGISWQRPWKDQYNASLAA